MQFKDREHAGQLLAQQLKKIAQQKNTVILGLPRGGVPVAFEVAKELKLPWDIFVVRKLGVPGHEELAMGAIAEDGTLYFNQDIIHYVQVSQDDIKRVIEHEKQESQRRVALYRGYSLSDKIAKHHIVLVDDGLATGATMRVAVLAAQHYSPLSVTVAVPVASIQTIEEFKSLPGVTSVVAVQEVDSLMSVGMWYQNFSQTTDEEVLNLKNQS